MSENLQEEENEVHNCQDELHGIVGSHSERSVNEKCAEIIEKINIYNDFITYLLNRVVFPHLDDDCNDVALPSTLEDANSKIQCDLNVVRDCLDNRKQIEEHAIDLLSEGMFKMKLDL